MRPIGCPIGRAGRVARRPEYGWGNASPLQEGRSRRAAPRRGDGREQYGTRTDIMANNPRKVQDPTEAALSAIQDALSLRDGEPSGSADAPILPAADAGDRPREGRRRSRRD